MCSSLSAVFQDDFIRCSLCVFLFLIHLFFLKKKEEKRNINYSLVRKIPTLEKHHNVVEMDEEFIWVGRLENKYTCTNINKINIKQRFTQ